MDWYPPPLTRVPGVHRLLVSQVLRLRGSHPPFRARALLPEPRGAEGYEATLDLIEQMLLTGISNIGQSFEAVWVPLTSGLDSRLILAAAHAAGIPVQTFTQDRGWIGMPRGDRRVPFRLAHRLGVSHRLVRPHRRSANRLAAFDAHTGGESVDQDRWFFARSQWSAVPSGAVVLRGGVFEVTRGYYEARLPERMPDDMAAYLLERFQVPRWQRDSFPHVEGLNAWLDWVSEHPERGIDWRDRVYHELRVGGWLATTEQALDLVECEMINPAACQRLLAASYSVPAEWRKRRRHHIDLIKRMAPALLEEPTNPDDGGALVVARRVRRQTMWKANRVQEHLRGAIR